MGVLHECAECTDGGVVDRCAGAWRRQRGAGQGGGGGGGAADVPIAWLNPAWGSFDDFWSSMLLLFVSATADGWDMFMFTGMDAVGPNLSPVRNDFSPLSMFFILWLVLGCFTMMNLFVGSI